MSLKFLLRPSISWEFRLGLLFMLPAVVMGQQPAGSASTPTDRASSSGHRALAVSCNWPTQLCVP